MLFQAVTLLQAVILILGISHVPLVLGSRTGDPGCQSRPKPPPPTKFGMILFRAFEPLDVFGPLEALQILSRIRHLQLFLISETMDVVTTQPVMSAMNPMNSTVYLTLPPTHTLTTVPEDLDVLIIPGGLGARSPLINATANYITATYPKLPYLLTVCTGSVLAARAGILDGKHATTNKASWDANVVYGPRVEWVPRARWVVDGKVWSSSGISAGIDATLAFIEAVYGKENATYVANQMEYERHMDSAWDPFADIFNVTGAN
ncbi:hypothetical protein RB597_007202 [Gaeumannomyces tritici]